MATATAQSQPKAPSNTGGDQGATNTGNVDGGPDGAWNTTTTPIAGELSQDNIA
jgi:hypothetical protein